MEIILFPDFNHFLSVLSPGEKHMLLVKLGSHQLSIPLTTRSLLFVANLLITELLLRLKLGSSEAFCAWHLCKIQQSRGVVVFTEFYMLCIV